MLHSRVVLLYFIEFLKVSNRFLVQALNLLNFLVLQLVDDILKDTGWLTGLDHLTDRKIYRQFKVLLLQHQLFVGKCLILISDSLDGVIAVLGLKVNLRAIDLNKLNVDIVCLKHDMVLKSGIYLLLFDLSLRFFHKLFFYSMSTNSISFKWCFFVYGLIFL